MSNSSPKLFVFTGTSGSGRKTAAHTALKNSDIIHIPSCTDRPPRSKEHPDSDYRYVSPAQFELMYVNHFFAEDVRIDHYRYGIGRRILDATLNEGNDVYMILNREGADKIRALYGDRVIRIFLYVDKNTVRERLESKGTPYEIIDSYLDHYSEEVTYRKSCEHVLENVNLEKTVEKIREIVQSYKSNN
ncbi:guanylate kinase [Paenibacillus sp. L3-i20]|uniref:guanylate kinase n=1 Tax=Paenibacillus sp. L3-i20 TaxID=2905833 RepID=UPI001EE13CBE|nr:guanylate kinase [Paenibacillus sp. L3-i20]GKU78193.1 guanylate kinase [Paenibacillus sp. L3-i20]